MPLPCVRYITCLVKFWYVELEQSVGTGSRNEERVLMINLILLLSMAKGMEAVMHRDSATYIGLSVMMMTRPHILIQNPNG